MKKLLLFFALASLYQFSKAQTDLYFKVRDVLQQQHPEINFEGKLIAVNIWGLDNPESKDANKGFDKAAKVYELAKLKGGPKGFVAVAVNTDNLTSVADIAFKKDNLIKILSVKLEELQVLQDAGFSNVVFDSNGSVVYKDLKSDLVFSSINNLITR